MHFYCTICCTVALLLSGCAGFGVTSSSDPLQKLNDAAVPFKERDRPLIAEKLIFEAIEIYEEQNDSHGLGSSHREYAELLISSSVEGSWSNHYRKNGFLDKSVTYDNRKEKADQYLEDALKFYSGAEQNHKKAKRYDALTNL